MLCCVVKDVACSTGQTPMLMKLVGEEVQGWTGDELDGGGPMLCNQHGSCPSILDSHEEVPQQTGSACLSECEILAVKACPHLIWIRSTLISRLNPCRSKLDQSTSIMSALLHYVKLMMIRTQGPIMVM